MREFYEMYIKTFIDIYRKDKDAERIKKEWAEYGEIDTSELILDIFGKDKSPEYKQLFREYAYQLKMEYYLEGQKRPKWWSWFWDLEPVFPKPVPPSESEAAYLAAMEKRRQRILEEAAKAAEKAQQ